MNRTGYQVLGYVVWRIAKLYLRHSQLPRKLAAAGIVGTALLAGVVVAIKRASSES